MKLLTYLKSPYPFQEKKWKIILFVSVFISLFLFLFQPFGLSYVDDPNKVLMIPGYGGVSFVVLLFNLYFVESIFPAYFSERSWTIIKHISWLMWILFTIGLANFLYSHAILPNIALSWTNFLWFQLFTLIVGTFPVTVITLISHNVYLRRYVTMAESLNISNAEKSETMQERSDKIVMLKNEAGNEEIRLTSDDFFYIESEGNYVTIHRKIKTGQDRITIRSTLKNAREQLSEIPSVVQCHRAYLVNCIHISRVKGNAQGYQLKFSGLDDIVPVSRSFIPSFNRVFRT
jgi:hypothetical protein